MQIHLRIAQFDLKTDHAAEPHRDDHLIRIGNSRIGEKNEISARELIPVLLQECFKILTADFLFAFDRKRDPQG